MTITQIEEHISVLLEAKNSEERILSLPLLSQSTKQQILAWSEHHASDCFSRCAHELIEIYAQKKPNACAVVCDEMTLSYEELNHQSEQLANYLCSIGVGPEINVAICLDKSLELIIGILAVMKTGGAFVPLDPSHPEERLLHYLNDAQPLIALTQKSLSHKFKKTSISLCFLDEPWPLKSKGNDHSMNNKGVQASNRAYIIYTSGSTGLPKGVEVEHKQLCFALRAKAIQYPLNHLKFLWVGTISFDISIANVLLPLITGGTLFFSTKISNIDSDGIIHLLNKYEINHFGPPVSLYSLILEQNKTIRCPTLEYVCVGGEALPDSIVSLHQKYFPHAVLFNEYGPTECTILSSYSKVYDPKTPNCFPISIGKPVEGANMFILDHHLQNLPVGVKGEIYIGGAGVARGYINKLKLTHESFVETSFGRLYKTKDLGCWLPNGEIQFFGRLDQQIKFRGYRIELEEIERTLCKYQGVQQAVVCLREQEKRLIAYLVLKMSCKAISENSLQDYLKDFLPAYMIPSAFIFLEKFPLTINGKINRDALPSPLTRTSSSHKHKAPKTKDELLIARIWSQSLKVEKIGMLDNFFELGGHSLLAIQVIVALQNTFKIEIPLKGLYEHPTLKQFAKFINHLKQSSRTQIESYPEIISDPSNRTLEFPLTDIQQAYWLGRNEVFTLSQIAVHGYSEYDFPYLDLERLEKSWNQLIQRHEALRLIFPGDGKQKILSEVPSYPIQQFDLSNESEENIQDHLNKLRSRLSHQVLAVENWPLFEICVTKMKNRYRLHFSIDGLIIDGWSFNILFTEWEKLYSNLITPLPSLEVSFRDYVLTEQQLKQSNLYYRDKNYWLSRLQDFPIGPSLPLAKHPKEIEKPKFIRCTKKLEKPLWNALKVQIKATGLTPTSFLLTLFAEILQYWSNSTRFTITLTLFNRLPLHPQINSIVGDFTSLTFCEIDHREKTSFLERARKIQARLFSDLDHRLFSGIEMLRELSRQHQSSWDAPLIPIVFTSLLSDESQSSTKNFTENQVYSITQTPQVWLDYKAYNHSGELTVEWDFVEGLFPENLIKDMHQAYFELLENLAKFKTAWDLSGFELFPASQKVQRDRTNATDWETPSFLLQELFHHKANEIPNQTAMVYEGIAVSYKELQTVSNQLGRYLRRKGAKPNHLSAIITDKGFEQFLACLGILNAGSAYMPISPDFPEERIAELLKLGEAHFILTQSKYIEKIRAIVQERKLKKKPVIIALDGSQAKEWKEESSLFLEPIQNLNDLAYVIFTSGSTGTPKGVMIDHKGAVNTILDINDRFKITQNDSILSLSNLNFDLSVYDIFGLLASGGTIVIPRTEDIKDPKHWIGLIQLHRITIWNSVPMFMTMLTEYQKNKEKLPISKDLRLILLSGDWIPLDLPSSIKNLFCQSEIMSLGGATEASIWSIAYPINKISSKWKSIPYGYPLRNQKIYVLNEKLYPSPDWVQGEIYIGGIGLAKGYWKNKEKTDAQFIFHPKWKKRLYKTGDLGKYHPDGFIEFLGRSDSQVKINGYRIELGEIQKTLEAHEDISRALVTTIGDKDKEKQLIAYLILNNSQTYQKLNSEIQNPLERTDFKLGKHNLRKFPKAHQSVQLNIQKTEYSTLFNRKSYRCYDDRKLRASILSDILHDSLKISRVAGKKADAPITISQFENFLEDLAAYHFLESPVAKYRYPSAGSLYPVQIYIKVRNISGIIPGLYYFNQIEKKMYPIENEFNKDDAEDHFTIFLMGKASAIKPLYGDLWRQFCELEIGYIVRLLNESAAFHNYQVSVRHLDASEPITALDISWVKAPQAFHLHLDIEVYMHVKPDAFIDLKQGWYLFETNTKKWILINDSIPLTPQLAISDSYSILTEAPFILFFSSKIQNHDLNTQAGMSAQYLMEKGIKELMGFCPIGTLDNKCRNQCHEILKDKQLLHILAAGPISQEQVQEKRDSSPVSPDKQLFEDLQHFLREKLPDYFAPSFFVVLEKFPLSANGKIDHKSLPIPENKNHYSKHYIPPRTDIEKKLAAIWTKILKIENIGIQDHFFQLGGHSLSAVQTVSQLRKVFGIDFQIKIIFEYPVLEKLAVQIAKENEKAAQFIYPPIKKVSQGEYYPLSFPQQRLWFLDQFLDNKLVYHILLAFKIKGSLSVDQLQKALTKLLQDHAILKTVFYSEKGIAKQMILETNCFELPIFDLSKESSLKKKHLKEEATIPFNLSKGPLIRGRLLKIEQNQHILLLTIHHIITDEWSIRILLKELSYNYNSLFDISNIKHPCPTMEYVDFACWQRDLLKDGFLDNQLNFWKKELENCSDLLNFPTDMPRPHQPTHQGALYHHVISSKLTSLLKLTAAQQKVTPFMFLFGVFQTFLHRYSGQEDILTGFPVANRHYPGVEKLLGYFSNTVVLRTIFNPNDSFKNLLHHLQDKLTKIFENQDVPFEYLVDHLKVTRDLSHHPLFQVMFVYRNNSMTELELHELEIEEYPVDDRSAKFDLTLTAEENSNEIKLEFEYATDLFEENTVQRIAKNFIQLLKSVLENLDQPIGLLNLIERQEYHQIVNEWNKTECSLTPSLCLHQLFERRTAQHPERAALIFNEKIISYDELNKTSNQLAYYLRKLNISSDAIVGLGLDRSIELIRSIYAIMKAGGAYLPLELTHPKDRLNYILKNANVKIIITLSKDLEKFSEFKGKIVLLDQLEIDHEDEENLSIEYDLTSLAYVIYTSGSTGQPKGVCIEHRGLTNRISWMQNTYPLMREDKILQKTPASFDVSVWEFFWPIAFGATLVIAPPNVQRDTEALIKIIQAYSITCIHFVPSMLNSFLELEGGKKCPSLRMVFASGETLPPFHVEQFIKQTKANLYNLYGPTEACIDVTSWDCRHASSTPSIPIGKPIWNTEAYILDQHLNPVPIGVSGELYLSGAGLARCYLNQPSLTTKKFLPLPFNQNKRAYKTGDQVRFLPDGNIEFLGRLDHQVKIRGYRIELGEIESILAGHEEVFLCLVDVYVEKTGHKSLIAYIILRNPIEKTHLCDYLSEKLPDYMIPSDFIFIEEFPLTTSGKIDRKALLQTDLIPHRDSRSIIAPHNKAESTLIQIWKEVLKLENIGVTDNYFELGGDSILSIQIVVIAKKYGYSLQLADLFSFPTIEKLASKIRSFDSNEAASNYSPFLLVSQKDKSLLNLTHLEDAYPLASLQAGMIYHNELNPHAAIYQDTFSYEMEGELNEKLLTFILKSRISIHPALRTSFNFNDYSEPLQLVHNQGNLSIQFKDISHMCLSNQNALIKKWFIQEQEKRFNLTSPTLLRFTVHKRSKQAFQLGLSFHHSILDGWSIATFISDIIEEYESKMEGKSFSPHRPSLSYGAYIQQEKQSAKNPEHSDFWRRKLQGIHQLKIYNKVKQGLIKDSCSEILPLEISLVKKLQEVANLLNVPLKSVLLAAYLRVLSRISGESDLITGYILNGRLEEDDSEKTLGLFLNTIPLRITLEGGSWKDLVQAVYEEEKQLLQHRWYPLAHIQDQHSGLEIFNTSFNYAHFHVYDKLKKNKHLRLINHKAYEKTNFVFSANFFIDPLYDKLHLSLEYDPTQISQKKIGEIFGYFENALKNIAYKSNEPYQYDPLLSENEVNTLNVWNHTEKRIHGKSTLLDLFEKQVQNHPNRVAAVFEEKAISYQELYEKANQVAHYLQANEHASLVAVSIERSIELLIGIIGILKAGKGFVPLDPNSPKNRLNHIFENSRAQILITQNHLYSRFEQFNGKILDINSLLHNSPALIKEESKNSPSEIAYILYTSGSTGLPKGVIVEHNALFNQIQWLQHVYHLTESDKILHHTSLAFDVSIEEIFWPLCSGATIVIAPKDIHQNIEQLIDLIEKRTVTILDLVPSLLETILLYPKLQRLQSLRQVFVGGEMLHGSLAKKFHKHLSACLHNMYGLTETTITCAYHSCTPDHVFETLPIGHPIWNTKIYILDEHLCPLPIGVPGEICISGQSLAQGYLNEDDLTKQRFVPNPFDKGTLLFKTGDLGYYHRDGSIEFLGRFDHQIKLRGQRIELEEIESVLKQHLNIHQTVVDLQKDENGNKQIVSYLVLKNKLPFDDVKLKEWLKQWIPQSWIPTSFIHLAELPLLPSGKIDRKALPKTTPIKKKCISPKTPIEKALAQIWKKVLQLKKIGINENFFALGGNSLSITVAAMHIRKKFKKNIPLRVFLENPTISHLASLLEEQEQPLLRPLSFKEVSLPPTIALQPNHPVNSSITHILLTGATGFLGAHLLFDLLENNTAKIFCLIRSKNKEEAENRLIQNFKHYFPKAEFPKERVIAFPGDLSLEKLGLNEQDYQFITQKIDIIYCCGALVHHVYDYKTLLAPNVLSINEILKIATTGPLKKIIYISTLSIAETKTGEIQEQFITGMLPSFFIGGYEQTKWMAEKLLGEASKRGIPVQIFRPSTIIGHSTTGISSYKNDHLLRLIKGCIQLKKAPDWNLELDMLPVDFVSQFIVKTSLNKSHKDNVFNLSNYKKTSWQDLICWINNFGYNIEIIPSDVWKSDLATVSSENALFPLLSLYLGNEVINDRKEYKVSIKNTLNAISKEKLKMPAIDAHSWLKITSYLSKRFFNEK